MNVRKALLAVSALALCALGALGCAADDVASPDEGAESEEELKSNAWQKFAGAWEGDFDPIQYIVFLHTPMKSGHKFFVDFDNGRRCVRAPCPATSRLEGWYTVGANSVTLHSEDPDQDQKGILGRYTYGVAIESPAIQLWRAGKTSTLTSKGNKFTYCTQPEDCAGQSYSHIKCVGRQTCAKNTCGFRCGL